MAIFTRKQGMLQAIRYIGNGKAVADFCHAGTFDELLYEGILRLYGDQTWRMAVGDYMIRYEDATFDVMAEEDFERNFEPLSSDD